MKISLKRRSCCAAVIIAAVTMALCGGSFATAQQPSAQFVQPFAQHGYVATICHAPRDGIHAHDTASATSSANGDAMVNGDKFHVYRTHASEPSIPAGWALGVREDHPATYGYVDTSYLC